LKLKVSESLAKDVGRAVVRLDPADMARLGVSAGEMVAVRGKRLTVGKAMPAYPDQRGHARIQIDGLARENAGASLGELVEVRKTPCPTAQRVALTPLTLSLRDADVKYVAGLVDGLPVVTGDRLRVSLFGSRALDFRVTATVPDGPVLIDGPTQLELGKPQENKEPKDGKDDPARSSPGMTYEDIGGLKKEIARVREIVELPLKYPEVFDRLGIDAPKGVLLYGPPGCGKTQIARAVARETDATFYAVNGPEIIHKFYGESEAHLRKVFDEASKRAPSIIFLDELDAIAPRRESVTGEVEKRVVAQLLALMDGMARRKQVVVIAATNLPNSIDPALRRPGRFDREIAIPVPDRAGRREILEIHSRGMPLAADVDLDHLAETTHGFVGADLEALCREAAMGSLRRALPTLDLSGAQIPYAQLAELDVRMADFRAALRDIEPSAVREVVVEVPAVRWEQVGGLADVKRQLVEAVEWPLKYPELFASAGVRPPKGVLLSGPPGCGKTLLAKAAATQTGVNFISVKGPSLLSKYVGESEKGVREVFRKAKQVAPCILFFDEIDALVPARGLSSDSGVTDRVIGQFLAELDGVEQLNGVLVLAATNRADILDPAVLRPGRFDLLLEIPPPDLVARRDIFAINLRDKPLAEPAPLDDLAERTEGFSGAEVEAVCVRAALAAVRDVVTAAGTGTPAPPILTLAHLESALASARPGRGTFAP
ncbi:MAG: CDC48 family AAA ATPase, partial [Gemmataceae bacterium]|nr:CDC48 family AAA ATPase [Gemmataceae bacterium]